MSSNENKNVVYQGTNAQGNKYTTYESGAFRYSNSGSNVDKAASHYYDTGKGHSFYSKNNTAEAPGYSFHENRNQGFRSYSFKGESKGNNGNKK